MKDHEFREAVNSLRDLAKNYGQTEQLREQCSYWLRDFLNKLDNQKLPEDQFYNEWIKYHKDNHK